MTGVFADGKLLECIFGSNDVKASDCGSSCCPTSEYELIGTRSYWKLSNEEESGTRLLYGTVIFDDEVERYKEIMQRLDISEAENILKYTTPPKSSYWKPSADIQCDKLNFPLRTKEFYEDSNTYRYFDDIVNFEYLVGTTPQVESKMLKCVYVTRRRRSILDRS